MEKNGKIMFSMIFTLTIILAIFFSTIVIKAEGNTKKTSEEFISYDKKNSWTIMIYLDGDNDLSKYAIQKIDEIREINLKEGINVIVLLDEKGDNNTHSYKFGENEKEEIQINNICSSWKNEVNMGDPSILLSFVSYCMGNYPAQNYLLEMWGHGYGQKGMCNDETSYDRLTIQEMTSALTKVKEEKDGEIDILALTACNMGDTKCIQELGNTSDYIIASKYEMPASGLPYKMIFDYLLENTSVPPRNFCGNIVETYNNYYHFSNKYTLSTWDTGIMHN